MDRENSLQLLTPPFWGNSDLLLFSAKEYDIRAIYCYTPLFTQNDTLVLLDPYSPTEEITTITPQNSQLSERFIAEGDLLSLIAVALPKERNKALIDEAELTIKKELRKGLLIDATRGELINLGEYALLSPENNEAIEQLMTYEDRLGVEREDIFLYMFLHNSSEA